MSKPESVNEAETHAELIEPALADLGRPEDIGRAFSGFQRFLYEPGRAA